MKKGAFLFFILILGGTYQTVLAKSIADTATGTFVLPAPSGKYGVGRSLVYLQDASRSRREVPVFIYYPADQTNVANLIVPTDAWRKAYLPVLTRKLGAIAATAIANGWAFFTNDAAAISVKEKFPLILFSHGMGWSTLEYSFVLQELASAGYVVAAVNSYPVAPLLQAEDGSFIKGEYTGDKYYLLTQDLTFALKEITQQKGKLHRVLDRIDTDKTAMAGHSMGGAAALLAASFGTGFAASVNFDGDLMEASNKAAPTGAVLFLNQLPAEMKDKSFADLQTDSRVGWRYKQMAKTAGLSTSGLYISIQGMYHSNFQDYALLPENRIPENIRKTRLGPINGEKCLRLITATTLAFFNETLRGQKADWNQLSQQHAEWRLITLH